MSDSPNAERQENRSFDELTDLQQRCIETVLERITRPDADITAVTDADYKSGFTYEFRNQIAEGIDCSVDTVTNTLYDYPSAVIEHADAEYRDVFNPGELEKLRTVLFANRDVDAPNLTEPNSDDGEVNAVDGEPVSDNDRADDVDDAESEDVQIDRIDVGERESEVHSQDIQRSRVAVKVGVVVAAGAAVVYAAKRVGSRLRN